MRRVALRLAAASAVAVGVWGAARAPIPTSRPTPTTEVARELAVTLNVRNLVAAIYLGPRMLDTFLEVTVIVLAAVGMRHLAGGKGGPP